MLRVVITSDVIKDIMKDKEYFEYRLEDLVNKEIEEHRKIHNAVAELPSRLNKGYEKDKFSTRNDVQCGRSNWYAQQIDLQVFKLLDGLSEYVRKNVVEGVEVELMFKDIFDCLIKTKDEWNCCMNHMKDGEIPGDWMFKELVKWHIKGDVTSYGVMIRDEKEGDEWTGLLFWK